MTSAFQSRQPEANWQAEAGIGSYGPRDRATGWLAFIAFAAVLLSAIGVFSVMQGLTALLNDDFYRVPAEALGIPVDYTVWGWVHILLGVAAVLIGWGLTRGHPAARAAAVVFAVVNAVANYVFLPAYPWWCSMLIAVNLLVIYAVTVHGEEMRTVR
ncbi:hypothetical protein ACI79C_05975 [Geodermatophilus sp. SYSU D00697]